MARRLDATHRQVASRPAHDRAAGAGERRLPRPLHQVRADRRHDHGDVDHSRHRAGISGRQGGCSGDADDGAGAGEQSLAGGAKYRIGAGGERTTEIYNIRVPAYQRSTHYIEGSKALAVPFGVDPARVNWRPEIFLSDEERLSAEASWARIRKSAAVAGAPAATKRLLVNLSASEPKRRWPDEKFIATLRTLRQHSPDMPIAVIGLPAEWESVQRVAQAAGALAVQTPKLRDAFALVGTADIVFTPDTSISHAASAFRRPSLVLLKREHAPYAPYDTPGEIILWAEEQIRQLPYERVSEALSRLVSNFG